MTRVKSSFKNFIPKSIRLSRSLLFAFILLVVPIFVFMIWYTFSTNEKMINQTAMRQVSSLRELNDLEIYAYFNPVHVLADSIAQLATDDDKFFREGKWTNYLLGSMNSSPNILSLDLGFEDGSFTSVKRIDAGSKVFGKPVPLTATYAVRWINKKSKQPNTYHYVFFDSKNLEVGSIASDEPYIPKTRGWYKEASKAGKTIMTNPDLKKSGGTGLSIAKPFFLEKNIAGVIAIDMSLDEIGEFLNSKLVSKDSISLLIDENGFIVASSDKTQTAREVDNKITMNQVYTMDSKIPSLALSSTADKSKLPYFFRGPDSTDYVAITSPFPEEFDKKWITLMVIPLAAFAGPLLESNKQILLVGICAVLLQIMAIYFLARFISKPLENLTHEIQALINLETHEPFKITKSITEISSLASAISKLKTTITAFISYVPRGLVNDLLKSGKEIEIGGESRYLTILFTDLKDFSSLSEITPSRELLQRVSSYLGLMTYAIKEESGTVDKFIGDAVMAFWGAPLLDQNHAYHACVAAIKGKRRMVTLNERLQAEDKPPLTVRIGIHSDAVLVGNIGSEERLSYTVMGDGVNIASRLEGINKEFGTDICISHSLFKEAGERLWVRPIDLITVKGRKGEFLIYELLGIRDGSAETQASDSDQSLCSLTKEAYVHYARGEYLVAKQLYESIAEQFDDNLSKVMIQKCDVKKLNPTL